VEGNPDVMFEGCASGGSRYDPGILYYCPQNWVSDMTDAPARARIQYGASLCYPLSTMSCHVTPSPNLRASHFVTMQARGDIAHLGATGYELDTTKLSAEDLAKVPQQVAAYRADEKLVLEGDLYRLIAPTEGSNLFAVMQVAKDKTAAKLTAMRFADRPAENLYPRGLEAEKHYCVAELHETKTGKAWMETGIAPAFPTGDYQTVTYHFHIQ
jgi:alpha-galactosidase